MTSAMAMFPGLGEAMQRFQEEGGQIDGTAMLTEMTFSWLSIPLNFLLNFWVLFFSR